MFLIDIVFVILRASKKSILMMAFVSTRTGLGSMSASVEAAPQKGFGTPAHKGNEETRVYL